VLLAIPCIFTKRDSSEPCARRIIFPLAHLLYQSLGQSRLFDIGTSSLVEPLLCVPFTTIARNLRSRSLRRTPAPNPTVSDLAMSFRSPHFPQGYSLSHGALSNPAPVAKQGPMAHLPLLPAYEHARFNPITQAYDRADSTSSTTSSAASYTELPTPTYPSFPLQTGMRSVVPKTSGTQVSYMPFGSETPDAQAHRRPHAVSSPTPYMREPSYQYSTAPNLTPDQGTSSLRLSFDQYIPPNTHTVPPSLPTPPTEYASLYARVPTQYDRPLAPETSSLCYPPFQTFTTVYYMPGGCKEAGERPILPDWKPRREVAPSTFPQIGPARVGVHEPLPVELEQGWVEKVDPSGEVRYEPKRPMNGECRTSMANADQH
jgi:hypothetical protein